MNFGSNTAKPPETAATALPATTAPRFALSNVGAGDAGKTLPTLTAMQSATKPGNMFNLALSQPSVLPFGAGFGQTTAASDSSLGGALTTLTFGTTTAPSFGGTTSVASTAPISFGCTPMSTPATGFNLGLTSKFPLGTTATTSITSGLLASTPATTATLGGGLTASTTSSITSGFPLTTTTTPATTSAFSLGSTANQPPTTMLCAFSLPTGTTAVTNVSTGFNLGTTVSTGFSLNKTTAATATTAPTVQTTTAAQTTLGTSTTTVSSSTSQTGAINFCQLEESINKWTLELEEQEKVFMNQAAQVNAWDKLLIANGEKIVTLNQQVERVKLEQQQLEHELDYVVGQQKELQDCLVPLEKELASVSASDPEREYTYRLAEKLDTQLKQMSEDLKEIVEHLNEANRAQDSSDPIVQIGKILNAHMNSLQWIDQRTAILAQKIQQIDQMHQNFRQENERSFSLAYN